MEVQAARERAGLRARQVQRVCQGLRAVQARQEAAVCLERVVRLEAMDQVARQERVGPRAAREHREHRGARAAAARADQAELAEYRERRVAREAVERAE